MRAIKFRAWHKTKKAFLCFELSELNDSMITKVEDGWYLEDCELMQYTGLQDKNGKDIYEGDILQSTTEWSPGKGYRTTPVWKDGAYRSGFDASAENVDQHLIDEDGLEIIGNRYEHPELLEAQS